MNAEYTGKKIVELRKAKEMTQKELADKLHVTDKAVSKWERGVNFPDLGLIEDLAMALESTPSILLGLEDASKEEIVDSFAEISSRQSQEAEKEIQQIGWITLFAGIFLIIFLEPSKIPWFVNALLYAIISVSVYTLIKYKAIQKFELMDTVLVEIGIVAAAVFLIIQLVTGHNPNYVVSAIIIGIVVVCIQMLFYRIMKPQWMKLFPVVVSIGWLAWGILLEVSKATWNNRDVGNLFVFTVFPAVACVITYFICRKLDAQKESLANAMKPFAIVLATALLLVCVLGQDLIAKTYVQVFHQQLEGYAEELLEKAENASEGDANVYMHDGDELCMTDTYGIWKVSCYPADNMVEFDVGGKGLVFNSTYWGFYYSPDNTHKVYQGADISLNVNENVADWYGEGDNMGKSTRLREKWFWYEASF